MDEGLNDIEHDRNVNVNPIPDRRQQQVVGEGSGTLVPQSPLVREILAKVLRTLEPMS